MKTPLIFVKIANYEYWPWWLFYLPMAPYWLYLALKTRSLTYFTAVNPGIEAGGFYGESKIDILKNIPAHYLPVTVYVTKGLGSESLQQLLIDQRLAFPLIAKPNIGERGTDVAKIENEAQLMAYHDHVSADYIIQEFVTHPIELGVLFSRLPHEPVGKVSSLTMKEFLTVKGDGSSTIRALIEQSVRARFQLEALSSKLGDEMNHVLAKDEIRVLEPIGNHCRGTKFLNVNHLINNQLNSVFNEISKEFSGFYYGRFDMKVASLPDLYQGNNIKILELNGVSSDPGHIYDPHYSLWKAYRDLGWHWRRSAQISLENQKNGVLPLSFGQVWVLVKTHLLG